MGCDALGLEFFLEKISAEGSKHDRIRLFLILTRSLIGGWILSGWMLLVFTQKGSIDYNFRSDGFELDYVMVGNCPSTYHKYEYN